jgi:diguanylate cyclase (GGDEF)-like protein
MVPLLSSRHHSLSLAHERAGLLLSRVRLTALIISILMLGWIPVDVMLMPWHVVDGIIIARLLCAFALLLLLFYKPPTVSKTKAYVLLAFLLLVPSCFFLFANNALKAYPFEATTLFVKNAYAHFSFLLAMLISLFPLTAKEGLAAGFCIGVMTVIAAFMPATPAYILKADGVIFIHFVITLLAIVAAVSQLQFMAAFVDYSSRDALTGCLKRDYGLKLIEQILFMVARKQLPCALAFIDLDHFKRINDNYGHDKGDEVLREAAKRMQGILRKQDFLMRWGGEEFVMVLPYTEMKDVHFIFEKLKAEGLGLLPDGTVQTASVGVVEYMMDGQKPTQEMIRIADERMYHAKKTGRNKVAFKGGEFPFVVKA